jgi:ketosteroid isomerase-like protein
VSERSEKVREAFTSLNSGSPDAFEALFAADGQWLGVPGTGYEGATPI